MLDTTKEPWPLVDFMEEAERRQRRLLKLRFTPDEYTRIRKSREPQKIIDELQANPTDERAEHCVMAAEAANKYYSEHPKKFIRHWGVVLEPREAGSNKLTLLPFVPFKKQYNLIDFIYECLSTNERGLVEKSRDMGATWTCVWISIHLWKFWDGAIVGWGSKGQDEVDQINNPNSILEKARIGIRNLPKELRPVGFKMKEHMPFMRITNPETQAAIIGDVGDNIGRGGRTRVTFKDESAHYVHPELVEAALSQNTDVQIDISSVHGLGNVFQRTRESGLEWYPGAELEPGRVRVLVMDWRDHPNKNQEWYERHRADYERRGLLHIWAQEVDRDYSASVEGVVIPALWVKAAIDAHVHLGLEDDGRWGAGLDIADEGGDTNAIAIRKGIVCKEAGEWGARDPGVTTRNVIDNVEDILPLEIQYDCIGIGVTVKSEFNRLSDEKKIPRGLKLIPWNASSDPLNKDKRVIEKDERSPLNGDFFTNLKAQAWWMVRERFLNTYRARYDPTFTWEPDDIISISSAIPCLQKLVKELSQPTYKYGNKQKLLIEKKPNGAKSPNLGDAFVMCFWPVPGPKQVIVPPGAMARARVPTMDRAAALARKMGVRGF